MLFRGREDKAVRNTVIRFHSRHGTKAGGTDSREISGAKGTAGSIPEGFSWFQILLIDYFFSISLNIFVDTN